MLNDDAVKKAADPNSRSELEASLAEHIKTVNESIDPHEQLDWLFLITAAWTVDNDLITPSLKVKRNRIEEAFAKYYTQFLESAIHVHERDEYPEDHRKVHQGEIQRESAQCKASQSYNQ